MKIRVLPVDKQKPVFSGRHHSDQALVSRLGRDLVPIAFAIHVDVPIDMVLVFSTKDYKVVVLDHIDRDVT